MTAATLALLASVKASLGEAQNMYKLTTNNYRVFQLLRSPMILLHELLPVMTSTARSIVLGLVVFANHRGTIRPCLLL